MLTDAITLAAEGQDTVRPFSLLQTHISGQAARLERVVNTILQQHNYPLSVSYYLAELMVMSCILYGTFKFEGIITLQLKTRGLIDTMVCDVTSRGHVRAYAHFDPAALEKFPADRVLPYETVFGGEGYLLLVMDREGSEDRYQGIVQLGETSLADSFEHYFQQSVQLQARIKLAVQPPIHIDAPLKWRDSQIMERFSWRAGGILLQHTPSVSLVAEDDWQAVNLLLETATPEELVGAGVKLDSLLYRLFHEYGVRAHEPLTLEAQCRCSYEKVVGIVSSMIQDAEKALEVTCEFCGKSYEIDPKAKGAQHDM